MNAIQQKCRPKHQVLVLKCYPRASKGAVDVKPNSSELSYLLFYATSRKSKIQKIGAYLEKKTASDVWRMRIGNVQVTLGILAALIEKSPKDVALIAPCVLKILDLILRSNDISMIESSLPTFDALCEHHDASSLFADQVYLQQYVSIVRAYAAIASTRHQPANKGTLSRSVQLRWQNAGLAAIKSIAVSEALATPSGRQIDTILPVILENLWTDNDEWLEVLLQRVNMEEKVDADRMLRRRTSVATVATVDTNGDANPATFSGSAQDSDKLAEEDTGALALQCLKSIFVVPNRPQIHSATMALIKFIFERLDQGDAVVNSTENGEADSGWAITIYNIISRWAPVQDRYVILIVAMDTLSRNPISDDKLDKHVALAAMISSLLRSDINLIGLSVMDILLGFIKHMRKLIHPGLTGTRETESPVNEKIDADVPSSSASRRRDLLTRLEQCVGDIATHVYYADQVTDMITTILSRLRPSRSSTTGTPQGEKNESIDGSDTADGSANLDAYFSHNQGRVSALKVIKAILLVANPQRKMSGNLELSRNRVPGYVWEGTYWLLRDSDGQVRKAYVDALVTWLDRETTPADSRARSEYLLHARTSLRQTREVSATSTRRAVSNASNRERPLRGRRSNFLPLLHIAIYDNALQYFDYESDLVMLHVLLTKLVFRLGVNVVRFGIPMVYRLQEDILEIAQPVHKFRIAALCHGYFWALSEKFDFEASPVGRAIHNEVIRRRSKGFWIDGINVPCPDMDLVGLPGYAGSQQSWDSSALEKEALLPFDDRNALVERICTAYEEDARSPPVSPAVSPGRRNTQPILGSTLNSAPVSSHDELPAGFREQMLTDWSREGAAAALAADSKAESLNGSKTGTSTTHNRLTIATANLNGHHLGSPHGSPRNLRPHSARAFGDRDRYGNGNKLRKSSVRSGVSPSTAGSSRGIASVEQLKMVLSGNAPKTSVGLRNDEEEEDDSGDSMVSYEYSPSETSFSPIARPPDNLPKRSLSTSRGGPLGSNPALVNSSKPDLGDNPADTRDQVPPVPPLPNSVSTASNIPADDVSVQDYAAKTRTKRNVSSSRGNDSVRARSNLAPPEESSKALDLQELLRGIDSHAGEGSLGNVTRPPY